MFKSFAYVSLGLCLFVLPGVVFSQNFYNYPVPVNPQTGDSAPPSGQTIGTIGTPNGQTGDQGQNSDTYDRNTGLTDSDTRFGKIIHDRLDITKATDDIYLNWQKLALLGKDQFEIERFYREIPPDIINLVKQRLRDRVMYNLDQRRLVEYTDQALDITDVRLALRIVEEETRRYSMENDRELRRMVRDQFGLGPFSLDELANIVQ